MRCLAYLIVDLGVQRAFGDLRRRDRRILDARLRLPSVESDRAAKIKRYRQVQDTARFAGSYAPEITNQTKILIARLEKRSDRLAQEAQLIEEARTCIDRTAKILEDLT
jgi:hypothetical protein